MKNATEKSVFDFSRNFARKTLRKKEEEIED